MNSLMKFKWKGAHPTGQKKKQPFTVALSVKKSSLIKGKVMLHHIKTIENVPATIAWVPLQNMPRYPRDTDGAFVNDGTPYGFFFRPNTVVVYNKVPKVDTFVDNQHV